MDVQKDFCYAQGAPPGNGSGWRETTAFYNRDQHHKVCAGADIAEGSDRDCGIALFEDCSGTFARAEYALTVIRITI